MKLDEFKGLIKEFVEETYEAIDSIGNVDKSIEELFERVVNKRIPVISSNLSFVAYNEEKQELSVWFKSRKAEEHYIYKNVSVVTFGELMKAESKGKYFIQHIKGNSFEKIN